uniref:DUF4705 domain-containing protein n=1 Tax=Pongo abelii TaxID=9601 RepID=A0A8I5TM64_PONAB
MAAPPGPALPGPPGCVDRPNSCLPSKANNLSGLSSCPAPASLCGPSPFSSRSSAGPPSASRWPAQMQPWLENSPCRPRSCFPGPSPGPALAWPHGGFPGPGSCLPSGSLDRPSSSLTVACFGPTHASRNPPSGVSSCLTPAYAGPGPPSRRAVEARLLPLVASPGPAPACWGPLPAQPRPRSGPSRPTSCLAVAASGHALARRRPLQAQLLPPSGLRRPSSCLHGGLSRPGVSSFASSPGPERAPVGLSRPSSSSRRPLQAQVVLQWASPGPALPPGCIYGPGICLTATALDPAPGASVGPNLPQAMLSRPSSGLGGGLSGLSSSHSDGVSGPPDFLQCAPLGPTWASRRPLGAQLVVKPASPCPGPACRRPLRAHHVLEWAHPAPAPASRRPLEAQPLPPSWRPLRAQLFLVLLAASTGPTPASQAKQTTSLGSAPARLPPAFVGPALSPAEALQARLLPPGGLRRRRPGCRSAPAGPTPASHGPLRARLSPGLTAASRGQVPACLPAASTGPAPP